MTNELPERSPVELQADDCGALITISRQWYEEAISALREQEKEPCEYCKGSEDLAYGHDSMQRTGRIYLDGNLLTADLYSESMAAAICFCPICGRPLKGE